MEPGGGYHVVSYLLQQTLRRLCTETDWIYAVFWRILPRNYPPPKWDTKSSLLDRSKGNKRNWILVWEDGFCDFVACVMSASESNVSTPHTSSLDQRASEGTSQYMQPELFFKMSHEVYSYGEGLMGKVAADNSNKWVYREPMEADPQYPAWQGALDNHPRIWEAQFKSGIETIAIVAVKEGLIQLGSVKKTMEDLNFVLYLQRKFNYLQSIPGVYAPHPVQLAGLQCGGAAGGGGGEDGGERKGPVSLMMTNCNGESSSSDPQYWAAVEQPVAVGVKRLISTAEENQIAPPPPLLDTLDCRPSSKTLKSATSGSSAAPLHLQSQLLHLLHGQSPQAATPSAHVHAMSSLQNLLCRLPSVTPPSYSSSAAAAVASHVQPQLSVHFPQHLSDTLPIAIVAADPYSSSHFNAGIHHSPPMPPPNPLVFHQSAFPGPPKPAAQPGLLPESFPAGAEWYAKAATDHELDATSETYNAFLSQMIS